MNSVMARITSVGTAVPSTCRDNSFFEAYLDTSDAWITQRTGIKQRYIWENPPVDATAQLGAQAAQKAIDKAGIDPSTIDAVICATFTPDNFFPATAAVIADKVGIKGSFAFDISAACAGFVYGLTVADSLIRSGQAQKVLLVGSEVISRTLDWSDRGTCILFGDGAGAVILEAADAAEGRGVLSAVNYTDGGSAHILTLPVVGDNKFLQMNGRDVFKQAVRLMPAKVNEALEKCNLTVDDLDLLVPHQANIRIIESVGERLGIDPAKVVINVQKYGNTSSATIPLALADAWDEGRIKEGTTLAITALGGGVTAGAAIIRF